MSTTYNVEFVLAFFVFNILVYLLETTCESSPPLRYRAMPDKDISLVCCGGYRGF